MEFNIDSILSAFPEDAVQRAIQDATIALVIIVIVRQLWVRYNWGPSSIMAYYRAYSKLAYEKPGRMRRLGYYRSMLAARREKLELLLDELDRASGVEGDRMFRRRRRKREGEEDVGAYHKSPDDDLSLPRPPGS
jgi:hypothetical protein